MNWAIAEEDMEIDVIKVLEDVVPDVELPSTVTTVLFRFVSRGK